MMLPVATEEVSSGLSWFVYVAGASLILFNLLGVLAVALQLPGTWMILFLTTAFAWWQWDEGIIGWTSLIVLTVLAVVAELIEFLSGSVGAKKAGGTRRGAWGALLGSIPGAIVGSFLIPIPVLGTILGACLGAAAGSMLGDRSTGMAWQPALKAGTGAAAGTFVGTILKVGVAVAMWISATVALVV